MNDEACNLVIKQRLEKNEKFVVGRVGHEVIAIYQQHTQNHISKDVMDVLNNNCGYYGNCIKGFCSEYIAGLKSADIQVEWEMSHLVEAQRVVFGVYSPDSIRSSYKVVEPFYFGNPWSGALANKKVLVVHPFSESIRKQHAIKDKLWENKAILPDFELITYKSVQSLAQEKPHSSWIHSLCVMKDDISKIHFDVALLGCGSYGMPLCAFIKNNLHKSAIYVGGGLQILFGICGKRWDGTPAISKFYNQYWTRPMPEEQFGSCGLVENGCYW